MVRMPRANMENFFYSLYQEKTTEYKTDADGNVIYVTVNGKQKPIERELPAHYTDPKSFKASITMRGGNVEAVEFGVDVSNYSAIITTPKGMLDITETSIIWHKSKPKYKKDGSVDESSADYRVIKCTSSLYYDRFVLAQRTNNNG